jgi:hypothetical protein
MKYYITFFFLFLFTGNAFSQFLISKPEIIQRAKKGTTFIVMKDPSSKSAMEYQKIYKKYWTFSPIEFISYEQIKANISSENSFLSFEALDYGEEPIDPKSNESGMVSSFYPKIYLELWVVNEIFFTAKKKREFTVMDHVSVASIPLYVDAETLKHSTNIFKLDYDGEGHIRNWGTGIVTNYIQQLMVLLKEEKEKNYKELVNSEKLKSLKEKTIYVPNYVLISWSKIKADESKSTEEKKLFKDYGASYELLPVQDLNEKILNSKEPFYYLLYVKVGNYIKFINVVDSRTGENVYCHYAGGVWDIEPKDLKELYKEVK